MHVTPRVNLRSILKTGLVPNRGGGNYAGQFESLDGVYLTSTVALIEHMLELRSELNPFVLVLVDTHGAETFPDEDLIDITFAWLRGKLDGAVPKRALAAAIARGFHEHARAGEDRPFDRRRLGELARAWLAAEDGAEDGMGELWAQRKDEIVRAYPRLKHPIESSYDSVRYCGAIEYAGNPGIVAIIDAKCGKVVKGIVPPEAWDMVADIVELDAPVVLDSARETLKTDRKRLYEMATRLLPDMDAAILDARIAEMDLEDVRRNLAAAQERMDKLEDESAPAMR